MGFHPDSGASFYLSRLPGYLVTPIEAYAKLLRIVHEVNGIVNVYKSDKYLSDVDSIIQSGTGDMGDEGIKFIKDDEEDTFQPQKGNVVFSCSLDGWVFGICEFADFYVSKLGGVQALCRRRYGFMLEPLWQNKDPKFVLQSVMSRWLPLSDAILSMVVKHIPDMFTPQSFRISRLLPKREILDSDVGKSDVIAEAELVRKSVEACDSRPEAPCVAFVCKFFAVPMKMLSQRDVNGDIVNNYHEESGSGDSDECFLAFAKFFAVFFMRVRRYSCYQHCMI
ncbi:elongation factor-like GTPase 1 [Tanacetum coccineum]